MLRQLQCCVVSLLPKSSHRSRSLLQSLGDYVRLGSTLDDAVGEAFDKVARDLGVPWEVDGVPSSPGAALEALARTGTHAAEPGLLCTACILRYRCCPLTGA